MQTSATQNDQIAIVRRLFDEVWVGGNKQVIPELFHDPAACMRGMEKFGLLREAFPDLRLEVERYDPVEPFVIAYYKAQGTHTGSWMGRAPTHKSMTMEGSNIYRICDGKIAEAWGHLNTQDALREIAPPAR